MNNPIKAKLPPGNFLEHFTPATELEQPPFSPMLQGTGSNKLSQISARATVPDVDAITGVATFTLEDWELQMDNYNATKGIRPSTHKLFNACVIALTANNHYRGSGGLETTVTLPLEEYMKLCGIPLTKPSKDKTRRRIQEDLETLFLCRLSWKEKKGKKTEDFSDVRILSSKEIRNGIIRIGFSPEITRYLVGAYVMQFPKALFAADERNYSTFIIGRKLALHYSMDSNQKKGTANIISVKTLLAECRQTIPSYEQVIHSDKRVGDRIVKPLEDALNALDFVTWEYANSKGVPLTDEQLADTNYADFIHFYIRFALKDFPDQTARLSAKM